MPGLKGELLCRANGWAASGHGPTQLPQGLCRHLPRAHALCTTEVENSPHGLRQLHERPVPRPRSRAVHPIGVPRHGRGSLAPLSDPSSSSGAAPTRKEPADSSTAAPTTPCPPAPIASVVKDALRLKEARRTGGGERCSRAAPELRAWQALPRRSSVDCGEPRVAACSRLTTIVAHGDTFQTSRKRQPRLVFTTTPLISHISWQICVTSFGTGTGPITLSNIVRGFSQSLPLESLVWAFSSPCR